MTKLFLTKDSVKRQDLLGWLHALSRNNMLNTSSESENRLANLLPLMLESHGWQGDAVGLLDALPFNVSRIGVDGLLGVMGSLGFRVIAEHRSSDELQREDIPGLFVLRDGRVPRAWLLRDHQGEIVWEDGSERETKPRRAKRGMLYRFERNDVTDETNIDFYGTQSWFRNMIKRWRPIFVHACLISLVLHILSLAMPIFSMSVYERVIGVRALDTLPMLAVGISGVFVVETLLRGIRTRLVSWMGARAGLVICQSMFERMLYLPASLIEQASVSAQIARIRAFEAVRDFMSGPLFMMLLELPFTVVLIIALAFLSGPVAMVSVGMMALYAVLLFVFRPRWQKLGMRLAHAAAQRQQLLLEIVDKLQAIYLSGIGDNMLQRFKAVSWRAARLQHAYSLTTVTMQYISAFLTVIAAIVTIGWCLNRIWAGEMTGGAMVASMIITWRLLYPLQGLCGIVPNLEQIRGAIKQVDQLMALPPERHALGYILANRTLAGKIEFQNVSLRYARKSDPVFIGLNATIPAGELIAVYGGNGSGKSSVLRLLLGLYGVAAGNIKFDGVDCRQFDPRTLRRHISYLPQVAEFIPGTIADNLRLENPLAEERQITQALMDADAMELVRQLPAGLETRIDGTQQISAGLAARLALARIYLSDRPILLCDELPSHLLNSTTGARFRQFLELCRGRRTVMFVTHREDWINFADQVIWMKPSAIPVVGRPAQTGRDRARQMAKEQTNLEPVGVH